MPERITGALARQAIEEMDRDVLVDRSLMPWGRLRVERMLPFLCLYRRPVGVWDHGTAQLLTTQASYLLAPGDDRSSASVLRLVKSLTTAMADACGQALILELWSHREWEERPGEGERASPRSIRPSFRVLVPEGLEQAVPPARHLVRSLEQLCAGGQRGRAQIESVPYLSPPRMPGLTTGGDGADGEGGVISLGLEVAPIFRELDTGELFPFLLDELRRGLAPVLTETVSEFVRSSSHLDPRSFPSLARSTLEDAATEVDRRLSELADRYDLLLEVTPVDSRECWEAFRASGYEEKPDFHYRALRFHPAGLKRELFDLPVDGVDEPLLARLFREKQEEIDRHLTMLMDRGTRNFFRASLQIYGELEPDLLELAETLLDRIQPPGRETDSGTSADPEEQPPQLSDREIVAAATPHLDHYRETSPAFPSQADLRSDIPPGLLVSRGRLLVGQGTRVAETRIEALMHHEVGTHMVTHYNGASQPLQLLRVGLAGYEPLQEALAVLAEYLSGGLTAGRLRTLAARVVAVGALIDGADFVQVHRMLRSEHGYSPQRAYSIAMRVFRGGGFTKDIVYLQGLVRLAEALREGIALDSLFLGKIALHRVEDIEDLRRRRILDPAPLRPAYLDLDRSESRLERLRAGLSVVNLLREDQG